MVERIQIDRETVGETKKPAGRTRLACLGVFVGAKFAVRR
jgi:hypothetical protein